MSLTGKAISYLRNTFPNVNFLKDIILQDDGDGPYIKYWGIGTPRPTEEEINAAAETMKPVPVYPNIEQQLILIYNDQKNGTKTFSQTIDKYYQDLIDRTK